MFLIVKQGGVFIIDNSDTHNKDKSNTNAVIIIVIIFATVITVSTGIFYFQAKKEYIDGNVLNIGYVGNNSFVTRKITSPWNKNSFYSKLMYRALFSTDETFTKINYDLATKYEILDDGLIYKITLDDNLIWSDGEELTVSDVVFSFEALLVSSNVNELYKTALSHIEGASDYILDSSVPLKGVEVLDNTIIISLSKKYEPFLKILTQIIILPEHCFSIYDIKSGINTCDYWLNPVVSGMYQLNAIVDDLYFSLIKNPNYIGKSPKIEEIRLCSKDSKIPIDFFSTNDTTEIVNLSTLSHFKKYDVNMLYYNYFIFNIKGDDGHINEAMNNYKVRQAISYAIDRETLFETIYFSKGNIINSGIPNEHEVYNDFSYEYDPLKAKELFIEANYDFDRPLRIAYSSTTQSTTAFINGVASNLKDIGLTVELISTTNTSFELYDEREYDFALKGLSVFDLTEWYDEYSKMNPVFNKIFHDVDFEPFLLELTTSADSKSYNNTLSNLQQLEQEKLYKLPLFTLNHYIYINEERLVLPKNLSFGNILHRYDLNIYDWEIKQIVDFKN